MNQVYLFVYNLKMQRNYPYICMIFNHIKPQRVTMFVHHFTIWVSNGYTSLCKIFLY